KKMLPIWQGLAKVWSASALLSFLPSCWGANKRESRYSQRRVLLHRGVQVTEAGDNIKTERKVSCPSCYPASARAAPPSVRLVAFVAFSSALRQAKRNVRPATSNCNDQ